MVETVPYDFMSSRREVAGTGDSDLSTGRIVHGEDDRTFLRKCEGRARLSRGKDSAKSEL
jgi:hypothetical protein